MKNGGRTSPVAIFEFLHGFARTQLHPGKKSLTRADGAKKRFTLPHVVVCQRNESQSMHIGQW